MTDHADLLVFEALEGMHFPAERHEVIDYASRHGEPDPKVLDALRALPDRCFSTPDDVVISVPEGREPN